MSSTYSMTKPNFGWTPMSSSRQVDTASLGRTGREVQNQVRLTRITPGYGVAAAGVLRRGGRGGELHPRRRPAARRPARRQRADPPPRAGARRGPPGPLRAHRPPDQRWRGAPPLRPRRARSGCWRTLGRRRAPGPRPRARRDRDGGRVRVARAAGSSGRLPPRSPGHRPRPIGGELRPAGRGPPGRAARPGDHRSGQRHAGGDRRPGGGRRAPRRGSRQGPRAGPPEDGDAGRAARPGVDQSAHGHRPTRRERLVDRGGGRGSSIAFEANHPHALVELAVRGLGVAIVPESTARTRSPELRAIAIARPDLRGRLALAWRADGALSPAARALIGHARNALPDVSEAPPAA